MGRVGEGAMMGAAGRDISDPGAKLRREAACRRTPNRRWWSGRNTKAIRRILVKELGKSLPFFGLRRPPVVKRPVELSGIGTDQGVATVYQKRTFAKGASHCIRSDACPVRKVRGSVRLRPKRYEFKPR